MARSGSCTVRAHCEDEQAFREEEARRRVLNSGQGGSLFLSHSCAAPALRGLCFFLLWGRLLPRDQTRRAD